MKVLSEPLIRYPSVFRAKAQGAQVPTCPQGLQGESLTWVWGYPEEGNLNWVRRVRKTRKSRGGFHSRTLWNWLVLGSDTCWVCDLGPLSKTS